MKATELLAAARRILWQTWAGTGDEVGSAGAQALLDAGMLVEPGGAAELARLRLLLNAQPVDLTEEQLGALITAGDHALSDYYHERQCACSEYPASCATNPAYRREAGHWDTDAFAIGMGAVLGLWESIRTDAAAAELAQLHARLSEFLPYEGLQLGAVDGRVSAACGDPTHPTWLRATDDDRGCPWCRVAELEALTPAPIQTCRSCGAGYTLGEPCSACQFRRLTAEAQAQRETEEPLPWGDPIAYGPTGIPCGCGRDAHSNLTPCRPDTPEDPPRPRGASEIKHPVMKPTRDHLAEHPLPGPRKDGAA